MFSLDVRVRREERLLRRLEEAHERVRHHITLDLSVASRSLEDARIQEFAVSRAGGCGGGSGAESSYWSFTGGERGGSQVACTE